MVNFVLINVKNALNDSDCSHDEWLTDPRMLLRGVANRAHSVVNGPGIISNQLLQSFGHFSSQPDMARNPMKSFARVAHSPQSLLDWRDHDR